MKNSRSMDLQAVALDRLIGVVWLPLIADELQRGRQQELQLGLARTETLISFKEGFRRRLPIDIGKLEKADEK
jgi:hypothetical protein